jgi:hypothetical protein
LQADLNDLIIRKKSTKVLILSDFIQHLGSHEKILSFLDKAMNSLQKDGLLYLSFFNFNIKNYLKSDRKGAFSNGSIRYERLIAKEIEQVISTRCKIIESCGINSSYNPKIDGIISKTKVSRFTGRWYKIIAIKK